MPYILVFSTIHGGRMTASVESESVDEDIQKALEDLSPKIRETPVELKPKVGENYTVSSLPY